MGKIFEHKQRKPSKVPAADPALAAQAAADEQRRLQRKAERTTRLAHQAEAREASLTARAEMLPKRPKTARGVLLDNIMRASKTLMKRGERELLMNLARLTDTTSLSFIEKRDHLASAIGVMFNDNLVPGEFDDHLAELTRAISAWKDYRNILNHDMLAAQETLNQLTDGRYEAHTKILEGLVRDPAVSFSDKMDVISRAIVVLFCKVHDPGSFDKNVALLSKLLNVLRDELAADDPLEQAAS
jgi:hypothetical protein